MNASNYFFYLCKILKFHSLSLLNWSKKIEIWYFALRKKYNSCRLLALSSARNIMHPLSSSNQFCPEVPFQPRPMWEPLPNLFSTVLRQVAFGLPCFLFSWEVHLRATLVILLRDVPSHRRRGFFIVVWTGSKCVLAWKSKFEIVLGQKIQQILRKHPLRNA